MLTQQKLQEILSYNESSGKFYYINSRGCKKKGSIAGTLSNRGYINIKIDRKMYLAHRLAWLHKYGFLPNSDIDHINHHRDDNRLANLREATPRTNSINKSMYTNNKSGVVGVSWHNYSSKWHAQIQIDGNKIGLGYHIDFEDAVVARKQAEKLYGFHENHGKEKYA